MTRECISCTLELREILSFQTGLNLVNAAVICAILKSIPGFGTLVRYNWPQVFEASDCLKLVSIYFDLIADVTGDVINLVISAQLFMPEAVED